MANIVLASASPRRRELLRQLGLEFTVMPSRIAEAGVSGNPPAQAMQLALAKARDVAGQVPGEAIVIGADTLVVKDGEVFGKPRDVADARRILSALQGTSHQVVTGVALVNFRRNQTAQDYALTTVFMRALSREEIDAYIATGEPLDKAGAYGIQGLGAVLITGINGCYSNVVGLPLFKLAEMLKTFGVKVL